MNRIVEEVKEFYEDDLADRHDNIIMEKEDYKTLLTALEEREGEIERIRGMEKDCKCPFCPIVERAGQAEVRDKACHDELLTIHTILACPAECPPVEDADEYIVRALKCYIHAMQMKERKDETS